MLKEKATKRVVRKLHFWTPSMDGSQVWGGGNYIWRRILWGIHQKQYFVYQQLEKIGVFRLKQNSIFLVFYCSIFAAKSAVRKITKVNNSQICLYERGKSSYIYKDYIKGRAKLEFLEENKFT